MESTPGPLPALHLLLQKLLQGHHLLLHLIAFPALIGKSTVVKSTDEREKVINDGDGTNVVTPNQLFSNLKMYVVSCGPFLTSPLGANFYTQGRSCSPGVNLVP
jgi:hypothetical protein